LNAKGQRKNRDRKRVDGRWFSRCPKIFPGTRVEGSQEGWAAFVLSAGISKRSRKRKDQRVRSAIPPNLTNVTKKVQMVL